ncbi:MAG: hypothetical protein J6S40_06850, partial [Thermoguttaceae bacterium]|nr:hypothetical protein [Thermoguttaceae bacterium]
MKCHQSFRFFFPVLLFLAALPLCAAPFDGVSFEVVPFGPDDAQMTGIQQLIDENVFNNLIAYPEAKLSINKDVGWTDLLTDGEVGNLGAGGRSV